MALAMLVLHIIRQERLVQAVKIAPRPHHPLERGGGGAGMRPEHVNRVKRRHRADVTRFLSRAKARARRKCRFWRCRAGGKCETCRDVGCDHHRRRRHRAQRRLAAGRARAPRDGAGAGGDLIRHVLARGGDCRALARLHARHAAGHGRPSQRE